MTVEELIKLLQQYPPDKEVFHAGYGDFDTGGADYHVQKVDTEIIWPSNEEVVVISG
jgi:hypothetical protein